jgi:hypothetical protein
LQEQKKCRAEFLLSDFWDVLASLATTGRALGKWISQQVRKVQKYPWKEF